MKKAFYLYMLSLLLITQPSCSNKHFTEFKIYPEQKETAVAAGGKGYIILKIEIPEYHYLYGNPKGPGIGKPTIVKTLDSGFISFEKARFAKPKKYFAPGSKDFVFIYENETSVLIPFTIKKGEAAGNLQSKIEIDALLCNQNCCIPVTRLINCSIKVLPEGTATNYYSQGYIEKFTLIHPDEKTKENISQKTGAASVNTELLLKPVYISSNNISNLLQAIFFGLLAGFILNFMPCVLPVVSLKVMSLVKHSKAERGMLIRLGLLFTLGILTSFAILACLALFLGYNWGELFQKRIFLVSMIALIFTLALSMLDVFTLNIPSFAAKAAYERVNPYIDSYTKGLLATLLATPCSGPFLGGTLAWTLNQPPVVIFIVFMSVGAGMSLPYLILTINPGLLKFIPKPGTWMIAFEEFMAFLLIATTVYLIGVLEMDLIMPTLWFLVFVGAGWWMYGKYGALTKPPKTRIAASVAIVMIFISGYWLSFSVFYNNKNSMPVKETPFTMEALNKNRDNGVISIVKFTADWCPNCRFVEKTALYTSAVINRIREQKIDLLIADITRENAEGQILLKKLGNRSIPFLAVFAPADKFYSPICLRDIYNERDVLDAIEQAVGSIPVTDINSIKFLK